MLDKPKQESPSTKDRSRSSRRRRLFRPRLSRFDKRARRSLQAITLAHLDHLQRWANGEL